jgi:spermidine/putrescine transport system permease protein
MTLRADAPALLTESPSSVWTTRLARLVPPVFTFAALAFLFIPIFVLIAYSFNASRSTVVWQGLTLDWYTVVFDDRRLRQAVMNSAFVALFSGAFSAAIGTVTALAIVRRQFPGKEMLSTALLAPIVLPEIVIAVALLVFMVALKAPLGFTSMIIGHVLVTLPFATLIMRTAAVALDPRLEEAAADLGANEWQTFLRVTLPALAPAILSAFLMAATLSFDNFVMSTFVTGVGSTTLPIYIYAQLKTGLTPQINALGTLLVIANMTVLITVIGYQFRLRARRQRLSQ